MFVGCCADCKYLDLIDEKIENKCPRCSGVMVSLNVSSDDWNKLDDDQMREHIEAAISRATHNEDNSKQEDVSDELPDYDEDYEETFDDTKNETVDDITYEFIEPNVSEDSDISESDKPENPLPTIKKGSADNTPLPTIKKSPSPDNPTPPTRSAPNQANQVASVRKKTVSSNTTGTYMYQDNTQTGASYNYTSIDATSSALLLKIGAIVVALVFVVLCMWRNSSLGGLAALISIIIPFRTTFMNGYDMFEDTHISIRYIIWGVLIIISLVGVLTSQPN